MRRAMRGWITAVREQLSPGSSPTRTSTSPNSSCENLGALERQVTPLEDRHRISSFQAGLVLFKACVGPGVLFLPSGVKNAGLLSAVALSSFTGVVVTWCMLLVLDAAHVLRRQGKVVTDFADVGEAACGRVGRMAVNVAIATSQLGFCTAYCVFIAENVQSIIFEAYGGMPGLAGMGLPCGLPDIFDDKLLVFYIILVLIPLLIPSTWVRQIRYFACSNFIASTLVLCSFLYMLTSFAVSLHTGRKFPGEIRMFDPSGSLVYLGTAVYAFEGVGVLLPTERCMVDGSKCRAVVCWTMLLTCAGQVLFAAAAYCLYRDMTKSVITISLSDGSALGGIMGVVLVQLAWVLEVFLTFPLQLFPAARLLEPACFRPGSYRRRNSGRKWTKNLIRTGLLLLCMAVSLGGYSSVDNLVSLIGALGCVPLAVVYPAFFHWKVAFAARANGQQALLSPESPGVPVRPRPSALTTLSSGEEVRSTAIPPIGSAAGDLAIAFFGAAAVLLTTVLAIYSWVTSDFHFQACILRQ